MVFQLEKMSVENWISNLDWIIFSLTNMNLNYTNDSYASSTVNTLEHSSFIFDMSICVILEENKINHFFISDC